MEHLNYKNKLNEKIFTIGSIKDLFGKGLKEELSQYDGVEKHDSEGITFFIASKNGKKCILNKKGEIQGDFYDEIEIKSFNKNLFFIASKNGKKCILNKKGEIQGDFYDKVELDGYLFAYTGGKKKIFIPVARTNKFLGPVDEMAVIDSTYLGYFKLIDEGKCGICNRSTGEYVIPMSYDDITCIYNNGYRHNKFKGTFKVKSGEKYGLYFIEGNNSKQVLNNKYDDIKYLGDNRYELTTGSETKVVTIKKQFVPFWKRSKG